MQVSIHIITQMKTPEKKEAQKSIQTMHSHICLNIPLTVCNNHCMAHFQQKLVKDLSKLTKITLWTSHNYWTNTFTIRFFNHVTHETTPTIPVIICGSAAWHFTVATAFVCPDSVCTLAFVLTSQIYEITASMSEVNNRWIFNIF